VTVTVEPIDTTQATDSLAREGTLTKAWGDSFTLSAQLDYGERSRRSGQIVGGGDKAHRAELTVKRTVVTDAGWTPQQGDRISNPTDKNGLVDSVVFYVNKEIPRAYWFGGVSTTRVLELVDRFPERKAEG
jgi:hypothetical protein